MVYFNKVKKELKEMKKELRQFSNYFKPDLEHYNIGEKSCKKVLDKIDTASKEGIEEKFQREKKYQQIIADSSFKPEIDYKAGEISADCTAENPLPFYHPLIHNMKLYFDSSNKMPSGNIYIIEANTNEEKPCLHIEALQCIKITSSETKSFLENFLPKLKREYDQKTGRSDTVITMNSSDDLKSNYMPISSAMSEYKKGKNTIIQYPDLQIPDGFYNFQGAEPGEKVEVEVLYK